MTRRFVLAARVCVFLLAVAALASSPNLNALPLPNAADGTGKPVAVASTSPVFLVAPWIAVGGRPAAVVAGDLNGDGATDLVVANAQTGNVDVLLGDGKGKFQTPVHYKVGGSPVAIVLGDLAGHGKVDIAVANQSGNSVSVLLGNGDGTFQAAVTYAVGSGPVALAVGDFNGDGHPDLLVANAGSNTLAVLTNHGDGTFQAAKFYSVTASPLAIAIADFNGDGKLDVATGNADGTVNILLGDGTGRFNLAATMTPATRVSALVVGDFNRDGKSDLAVADPVASTVSVFLGRGDGTFQASSVLAVGNEPVALALEDLNADGVPDLLAVNESGNTVSVMLGAGDGTFRPSAEYVVGNSPAALAIADFNGDGHLDLVTANSADGTVSMPLGNGDGTFKAARSYSARVQPVSIASGNLNGSKIPALVVANYCGSDLACSTAGSVAVFLADDKGVYRLSSTYTVGAGPVSVALADLKGDRNLDIVALNRLDKSASVMLGLGDGTFRMPMTFSLAGAPVAIAVGDLNKDGKPDLAVLEDCGSAKCSQAGSVEILMGAGDGSFQSVLSYPVGYSPASVAVGDINGDKNLDLVVANRCGNDASCQSPGTASVLLGDGTGKFTPGTDIALGNSPSSIALGNLTGSRLDLVISRSTDNTVAVLHGNGDGTFRAAVPYPVGNNPGVLVVADFNGDGKADVAVANVNDSTVSVLFGKGDGTLQPATALAVGSGPTSLTAVGRINTRHASLATTNGNGGSSSPGTEFTLLPNLQSDPPLASFVLVPSPTPASNVNDSVLLTATLTGVSPNPAPSGTVTFDSGGTALSDCTGVSITQGISPSLISTATCTTQMLTAGSDSLTAVYSGDTIYDTGVGETSPAVTQTVSALAATLGLSSPGASTFNVSVTFTAQLSGVALTPVVPSGTVAFTANVTTITGCGTVGVNASGTATCSTSSLVAPSDPITATYSGDINFTVAAVATMTQTVNQATPNVTTWPTASAITYGQTLASSTLTGGTASVPGSFAWTTPTTVPGVGTPSESVTFTPTDTTDYTTVTGSVSVTVNKATPTVTFTGAPASAIYGASFTVATTTNASTTAVITSSGACSNSGTTVTMTSGTGTCSLTATWAADSNYSGTTATQSTAAALKTPTVTFTGAPASAIYGASFTVATTTNASTTAVITSSGACSNAGTTVTMTSGTGTCSMTATWAADSNYSGTTATQSTAAALKTPTVTFTGAPASAVFGTTFPVATTTNASTTAAITAAGACSFHDNGNGTAAITMSSGTGTCSMTATWAADSNYSGTTATQSTVAALKTPTVTFTGAPASAVYGTSFTVATTTNASTTAAITAGGVCSVVDHGNGTGTATMTSGTGTCSLTATWAADSNYSATTATQSTSATKVATTIAVTSVNPASEAYGQDAPVTITAVLSWTGSGAAPTASDVTIGAIGSTGHGTYGATSCGAPSGDTMTCTATYTPTVADTVSLSPYTETAAFAGDTNYSASTSTQNGTLTITQATTTTAVTSSLNPSDVNESVTFTATVTPQYSGTPTGTITFAAGATQLCTGVVLANAVAKCTYLDFAAGGYPVTASYSGDSNFLTSPGSVSQVVDKTATTTAFTTTSSVVGTSLTFTFTATVAPAFTGFWPPTGGVNFYDGTTLLNSTPETLNANLQATFSTTTALSTGTHSITAVYCGPVTVPPSCAGDGNFLTSTSAATTFVFSVPPSPPTIISGQPSGTITLTPDGAKNNATVAFSCLAISGTAINGFEIPSSTGVFATNNTTNSNLSVSCYFNPTSVTAPATTSLTVCTTLPSPTSGTCSSTGLALVRPAPKRGSFLPLYALALGLPGIVFLGMGTLALGSKSSSYRCKISAKVLGILFGISLLLLLAACGGGFSGLVTPPQTGSGDTPAGNYTLTVLGTGSDGSVEIYNVNFTVNLLH